MTISTRELTDTVPQIGRLRSILLRTGTRGPMTSTRDVEAVAGIGLVGDHRSMGRQPDPAAKRQVTLIQSEHLPAIAALAGHDRVDPALLRRNLVIEGINLASLRERRFAIGSVLFEGTGWCHPCSRMEEALGTGGFQAMRGHGGITARVLDGGTIGVDDPVEVVTEPSVVAGEADASR